MLNSIGKLATFFWIFAASIFASGLASLSWAEEVPREFYCRAEQRFLSDMDFFESVFAYEISQENLTEPYISIGMAEMIERRPSCCSVLREENPFNEGRGFLDRLLFSPSVLVLINWNLEEGGQPGGTDHGLTICGRVMERRGSR